MLIDEIRGREIAEELGIRIVGLVGILIKAKAESIIPAVKPLLNELITKAGFLFILIFIKKFWKSPKKIISGLI